MCTCCARYTQVHPLDLHGAPMGVRLDHHRCLLGYDDGGSFLGGAHALRALRDGIGRAGRHGTHSQGDAHAQAITVSVAVIWLRCCSAGARAQVAELDRGHTYPPKMPRGKILLM